jgi:hypothetical protein
MPQPEEHGNVATEAAPMRRLVRSIVDEEAGDRLSSEERAKVTERVLERLRKGEF